MEEQAPREAPKKSVASAVITIVLIAVVVAGFVSFVVFYPAEKKTDDVVESSYGKRPKIGTPAPDFTLTDTNGKQWSLSELRGKAVLVNFWATWCPPCRMEMPTIGHLHELNADNDDFRIVTILYRDNPESAKSYFASNGFKMPILLDPDSATARSYGITAVPETFIVDKQGKVQKVVIGPPPGGFDTPEYLAYFKELAGQ